MSLPVDQQESCSLPSARRRALCVVVVAWALLWLVRLTGPDDLMSRDQERVGTYVLDIVQNGNWLLQHDIWGNVASKPPLFNWLAALPTVLLGRLSRFSLTFPSAISSLTTTTLVMLVGCAAVGVRAGTWAALLLLYSQLGLRSVLLARTDTLFQCTIFLTTLLGYRAWIRGRGWTLFWVAATAASMTKGPHGILLAAGGLCVSLMYHLKGSGPRLRGNPVPGILLFFGIPLAWLGLAYLKHGQPVLDKLIIDELVGHAVGEREGADVVFTHVFRPSVWFLLRAFPLSLFAIASLYRLRKHPPTDTDTRRFLHVMTGAWLVGMLLLSLQTHHRFIHLLPILPAASLLAGWELTARFNLSIRSQVITILAVTALSAVYLNVFDATGERLVRSQEAKAFASWIEDNMPDPDALQFRDAPCALQLHLNVFQPVISDDRAAALLRDASPVFIAVSDLDGACRQMTARGVDQCHVVAEWPVDGQSPPWMFIISNRPLLGSPTSQ